MLMEYAKRVVMTLKRREPGASSVAAAGTATEIRDFVFAYPTFSVDMKSML
jgi:hypothetical protein